MLQEVRIASSCKLKLKLGTPLCLYFSFSILLVFSSFLEYFSVNQCIAIHIRIDYRILSLFLSVGSDSPTVANGPLSAMFSFLAQTSSYVTDC